MARLYGEHHGYALESPGFEGYGPSVPTVLLPRLGPTQPVHEIVKRHMSEHETLEENYIPQYKKVLKLTRGSVNYAWCAPEYVTGRAMFDVRLWEGDGRELDLDLTHNYRSPYMINTVGSDLVTVSYDDRTWKYYFGKNTASEVSNP